MSKERLVTVVSHQRPAQTRAALVELGEIAAASDAVLLLDDEETAKLCADGSPPVGVRCNEPVRADADLCVALGGDGTILRALRLYADRHVPVFGVNFGEVGFLATVEPSSMRAGFELALAGDIDVLELPAIIVQTPEGSWTALNDVTVHRKVGGRVAELSYALRGEDVSSVRCDGVVIATPAGSTGYNLANGGPVLAWGVQGMVMSFIAPHSLSARALVIAPSDAVTLHNSSRETLDLIIDGRPVSELRVDGALEARFAPSVACLAQMRGASFYKRMREKFGRLAR
jgi:NAD+ kinase